MNLLYKRLLLTLLLTFLCFSIPVFAYHQNEVFDVVDEDGNLVTKTSLTLTNGDIYISANNTEWEISGKEEGKYIVKKNGVLDLSVYLTKPLEIEIQADGSQPVIGIYHTHSSESYAPGEYSQPYPGEIYQVGETLKNALEEQGFKVNWSQANHNPHDGSAYIRSRDTAAKLLQDKPIAVIDVHRDAVPDREFYSTEIDGKSVAKVRIVTGKQNQNRDSNFEFAKAMKAQADEAQPGITEGIFWAKGNYNQDLGPRMILLEFGTHVLTLEEAQAAAERYAEVISASLPVGGGRAERSAASSGVVWVIVIALAALGIFLFINKNGLESFKNFAQRFTHSFRTRKKTKENK